MATIPSCLPAAIKDHYLYAFCPNSGLKIYDISDPTNGIDVGYADTQTCQNLALSGNYAYVVNSSSLQILNISNPTDPVIAGHVDGIWTRVAVSGDYMYLVNLDAGSVYNISDPAHPQLAGSFPAAAGIALSGNYAYLPIVHGSTRPDGLMVCDFSNPAAVTTAAFVTMTNTPEKLLVAGNNLYARASDKAGIFCWIFDISSRTNPVHLQTIWESGLNAAVAGNYLYLSGFSHLEVYDVSNPTNPPLAGWSLFNRYGSPGELLTGLNHAYEGAGFGITVYSLGNPARPELKIEKNASATSAVLSWPTPAAAFIVQQTPDLTAPNWLTVTDRSLVVGGRNQIAVPAPPARMFYRLVLE